MSGREKNQGKNKKRYCSLPDRASGKLTGETQPMVGLVRNVASPGLGVSGQAEPEMGVSPLSWTLLTVVGA